MNWPDRSVHEYEEQNHGGKKTTNNDYDDNNRIASVDVCAEENVSWKERFTKPAHNSGEHFLIYEQIFPKNKANNNNTTRKQIGFFFQMAEEKNVHSLKRLIIQIQLNFVMFLRFQNWIHPHYRSPLLTNTKRIINRQPINIIMSSSPDKLFFVNRKHSTPTHLLVTCCTC